MIKDYYNHFMKKILANKKTFKSEVEISKGINHQIVVSSNWWKLTEIKITEEPMRTFIELLKSWEKILINTKSSNSNLA